MQAAIVCAKSLICQSLMSIPGDVLLYCVLTRLPLCSLVTCRFVCKRLNVYAEKALKSAQSYIKDGDDDALWWWWDVCPRQIPVLLSAYEHGTVRLLRWFRDCLKYRLLADDHYIPYTQHTHVALENRDATSATSVMDRVSYHDNTIIPLFMRFIAMNGNADVLQSVKHTLDRKKDSSNGYYKDLLKRGCFYMEASEKGRLPLLQWARNTSCCWRQVVGFYLFDSNGFNVLHEEGHKKTLATAAARGGHLNIIKWLHSKEGLQFNVPKLACSAAMYGHVLIIEWLFASSKEGGAGIRWPVRIGEDHYEDEQAMGETICESAAMCESPRALQWAIARGYRFNALECFITAVANNSIQSAEFILSLPERKKQLVDYYCSLPEGSDEVSKFNPVVASALHGHFEMLQWVCVQFPEELVDQWLERNKLANRISDGPVWTDLNPDVPELNHMIYSWSPGQQNTPSVVLAATAAKGGNLKLLKWLLENGCPWNIDAFSYAVESSHIHMLQWMFEQKNRLWLPLDRNGLYRPPYYRQVVSASVALWMAHCGMIKSLSEPQLQEYRAAQRRDAVLAWLAHRRKHVGCLDEKIRIH